MKKYTIYYFLNKDDYIKRDVEVEEEFSSNRLLNEFAQYDFQTWADERGNLCRVNMNNIYFIKIFEDKTQTEYNESYGEYKDNPNKKWY